MKIGEFTQACGSSVRMIRFYESLNLIFPKRGGNGYRIYSEADVAVVRKSYCSTKRVCRSRTWP